MISILPFFYLRWTRGGKETELLPMSDSNEENCFPFPLVISFFLNILLHFLFCLPLIRSFYFFSRSL